MDAIREFGCIACHIDTESSVWRRSPYEGRQIELEIHHMLRGNKRIGHGATVCLCKAHHKRSTAGISYDICRLIGPSWHEQRREFRDRYGEDDDLVYIQSELIGCVA